MIYKLNNGSQLNFVDPCKSVLSCEICVQGSECYLLSAELLTPLSASTVRTRRKYLARADDAQMPEYPP